MLFRTTRISILVIQIGLNENSLGETLLAYPNPASNNIIIQGFENTADISKTKIVDLAGNIVYGFSRFERCGEAERVAEGCVGPVQVSTFFGSLAGDGEAVRFMVEGSRTL